MSNNSVNTQQEQIKMGGEVMEKHSNLEHTDEDMVKMEVNLDDTTGELLGYLMNLLFETGSNDVYYTPIYMKKNRPAIMLSILTHQSRIEEIKHILFKETTTLGIRYYPLIVHRLAREFTEVHTKWGTVRVKQGYHQGVLMKASPEYEDCLHISHREDIPLKEVYYEVWKKIYLNL